MLKKTVMNLSAILLFLSITSSIVLSQDVESIIAGKDAPNIVAKTVDGKDFDLSKLKGKLVLVDFWATWCPPCREQIPFVVEANKKFKDKGLVVVSIAIDETEGTVKEFAKEHKMDWIHLVDETANKGFKFAGIYDVMTIPTMFLIDHEGKVVLRSSEDFLDKDLHSEQLMKDIETYIKRLPDYKEDNA
jgi:thiol-disulfide isomerase/thioredoxin